MDCGYRLDLFVDNKFLLGIKAVIKLLPLHWLQLVDEYKR
ncbi:hypothetical protein GX408_08510 [bacterium]|nr:hypothetical protein [bacterium]